MIVCVPVVSTEGTQRSHFGLLASKHTYCYITHDSDYWYIGRNPRLLKTTHTFGLSVFWPEVIS